MVTVFTPTYNRAHLLPKLYKSLQNQTCKDFEWLIVDDGSIDETERMVKEWIDSDNKFPIRYYKVSNGGKMRAINYGASIAKGNMFCGVDSDDWLYSDAISCIKNAFNDIEREEDIIGVSFAKNDESSLNLMIKDKNYIDIKNFDRNRYGMEADQIMIFYTETMRQYRIPVWSDEKFTPESVFIDQMALDGYKMRYFFKSIYGGEYHNDGLSAPATSWRLLRDNPMGYAMMYNIHMQFHKGIRRKLSDIIQFVSCCCIKREYLYVLKCYYRVMALFLFIPGLLLAQRRRIQFKKYC